MRPLALAALAVLILAGCATLPTKLTELTEDRATVNAGYGTPYEEVLREAIRGCAIYDREPVQITTEETNQGVFYLFACR